MHALSLAAVLATYLTAVNAQVVYTNGTFQCLGSAADKNFCAGDSLSTNIIIRCTGTNGQPGNCNDNLAGVPPVGVKTFAPCFQTSNTSGDASCSFAGIAYPSDGRAPFNITDGAPVSSSSSLSASSTTTVTATESATETVSTSTTVTETTSTTATETAAETASATETATETASESASESASATETATESASESASVTESTSASASTTVTSVVVVTASGSTYTTAVITGTAASTPTVTPFPGAGSRVGVVGGVAVGVVGVVLAML